MKALLTGLVLFAGAATAAEPSSFQYGVPGAPQHPALYSFVDVYRLTVGGALAGTPGIEGVLEAPVRVAVAARESVAEPRFLVSPVAPPDKWLLLLAGVALAGWVAHRRLVHSL